jgi:hypothetical protein
VYHSRKCTDSNVTLSVRALKKTTVLAEEGKTVVRIPVTNQGEVFMPFPGWELMLLLGRSRPNEKRVLTTMTPLWGIARRPRSLMRTTTSPSHPAPRYAWCRADSMWQTLPQARTVTPHHWSSQTSRLNDGIASHTRQQTQSSQTRWQAESKNIRRSWKTRLMQESTTGTEPPYQSQRSRDGSTIWEGSDRITTYITCQCPSNSN